MDEKQVLLTDLAEVLEIHSEVTVSREWYVRGFGYQMGPSFWDILRRSFVSTTQWLFQGTEMSSMRFTQIRVTCQCDDGTEAGWE